MISVKLVRIVKPVLIGNTLFAPSTELGDRKIFAYYKDAPDSNRAIPCVNDRFEVQLTLNEPMYRNSYGWASADCFELIH